MEATAAAVGPAAALAALPGPPVPATTAGAAQRAGASEPSRPSFVPPGTGRGKGSGPRSCRGPAPHCYKEVPGPGKTLRAGALKTKRIWILLLLGGPRPHLPLAHHGQGTRAVSNTGATLPRFLLEASSPGWGPQLSGPRDTFDGARPGSLPCHSIGPSAPLYPWADTERGQQAGAKLDRRKNGLTLVHHHPG